MHKKYYFYDKIWIQPHTLKFEDVQVVVNVDDNVENLFLFNGLKTVLIAFGLAFRFVEDERKH